MVSDARWVLLAYRLPREPSTPRTALWRRLRRLGAAQVLDGLAALPETDNTREQLDWLAQEVVDAGGEATVWVARPGAIADGETLANRLREAVTDEYRALARQAQELAAAPDELSRELPKLRRELGRIHRRDYFAVAARADAQAALKDAERIAQTRLAS
jgi:hypothetical protein